MNAADMAVHAITAVSSAPVNVKPEAGPTTYGVLGINGFLAVFLALAFKFWPKMKEIGNAADGSLRTELLGRIKTLEAQSAADKRECDDRITAQRDFYETKLAAQQRKFEAIQRQFFAYQMALVKYLPAHATNDAQAHVNGILRLIEKPAEEFIADDPDADLLAKMDQP